MIPGTNFSVAELLPLVSMYAVRVAGVLLFLIVARIIAGWLGRLLAKSMDKAGTDPTISRFMAGMVRTVIMIMAVVACLGVFGVETTSFAALIAGAGLAIGLAFQGTLSNFSAGVMLLVFRPFKAGDVVSVAGQTGKVEGISLFTTTMDTPDNRRIILPNGSIFGSTIENITHHDLRRVSVDVGVDYSADIDKTREVLMQAIGKVELGLADPAPAAVLTGLGASSVDWQVRLWCRTGDFFTVLDELTRVVKMSLDEAGIGIPYPQMDVHLDKP